MELQSDQGLSPHRVRRPSRRQPTARYAALDTKACTPSKAFLTAPLRQAVTVLCHLQSLSRGLECAMRSSMVRFVTCKIFSSCRRIITTWPRQMRMRSCFTGDQRSWCRARTAFGLTCGLLRSTVRIDVPSWCTCTAAALRMAAGMTCSRTKGRV